MSSGYTRRDERRIGGARPMRVRGARAAALALLGSAAAVAGFAPRELGSQETPAPAAVESLRLGELREQVARESPRAVAARAGARAAAARVPGASLPPDPELQLGFMNYMLPSLRPMDPLGMVQLQLMQMIPVAGKLGLAGRVAAAQASAQAELAGDVGWQLRTEAAMAFYDIYLADRRRAVARETLRLLQDIARTTESMYRVGEGRQADVLRAQLESARMVEDTLRIATMRVGMAARLNALLDRPAGARVGIPVLPAFPESVPSLDGLMALAERDRPTVRAGERAVDAADARARLAARELWPDLEVGVQYGQRGDAMGTERMGSLMLGATIPIFAGRRQLRMREEAAAMRQMAAAELTSVRAETRGRVAEAYASLVRARNLTSLYRTTILPLSEAAVTSAAAAYRVGGVDFMTLLESQMLVNDHRRELSALEAEQGKAWAELEMLLGRELFDANHDSTAATAATPAAREEGA